MKRGVVLGGLVLMLSAICSCVTERSSDRVSFIISQASVDPRQGGVLFSTKNPSMGSLWINPVAVISNADVKVAMPVKANNGWEIEIQLQDDATKRFDRFTSQHSGELVGILIGGNLFAYPQIKEPISNGRLRIPCALTKKEAQGLASAISK